jgi:aerobic C4-dicarboxylate transport protein
MPSQAHATTSPASCSDIIPDTLLSALTEGSDPPDLFVAILFGIALALVGEPAAPVLACSSRLSLVCSGWSRS